MTIHEKYDLGVVKWFTIMSVVYLIAGTTIGTYLASELAWPYLNDLGTDWPYFQFGRLRPLHTNAVIFGFGGSALMATAYYIVQKPIKPNFGQIKWPGHSSGPGISSLFLP